MNTTQEKLPHTCMNILREAAYVLIPTEGRGKIAEIACQLKIAFIYIPGLACHPNSAEDHLLLGLHVPAMDGCVCLCVSVCRVYMSTCRPVKPGNIGPAKTQALLQISLITEHSGLIITSN